MDEELTETETNVLPRIFYTQIQHTEYRGIAEMETVKDEDRKRPVKTSENATARRVPKKREKTASK